MLCIVFADTLCCYGVTVLDFCPFIGCRVPVMAGFRENHIFCLRFKICQCKHCGISAESVRFAGGFGDYFVGGEGA